MTIAFTMSREALARKVLRRYGVLASGGADNSADMTVLYEAIDLKVKELSRLGIFWRKVDAVPFTFSASAVTISASATSDILFPIKMTISDGSVDQPVDIIDKRTYAGIYNKQTTGLPTKALWKGGGEFLLYPVPTVAATIKLLYERIADDSSAGSAPDIDVAMLSSFEKIITYECADEFEQDERAVQRFMKEAEIAEKRIRNLSAQRTGLERVAVDDWDDYPYTRRETDYGF